MTRHQSPGRKPGPGRGKATPSILGTRMLLARRAAGMTQVELAKRIEGNNNTLAKVERGTLQFLRADAVGRIAQALGVSTDYLLGLTDNPTPPFAVEESESTTEEEPLEVSAQLELTAAQA